MVVGGAGSDMNVEPWCIPGMFGLEPETLEGLQIRMACKGINEFIRDGAFGRPFLDSGRRPQWLLFRDLTRNWFLCGPVHDNSTGDGIAVSLARLPRSTASDPLLDSLGIQLGRNSIAWRLDDSRRRDFRHEELDENGHKKPSYWELELRRDLAEDLSDVDEALGTSVTGQEAALLAARSLDILEASIYTGLDVDEPLKSEIDALFEEYKSVSSLRNVEDFGSREIDVRERFRAKLARVRDLVGG